MNLADVTNENLIEAVREAAAKYPNRVRADPNACQYFHDNGKPSCIVGHGLYKLGVKRKNLLDISTSLNGRAVGSLVGHTQLTHSGADTSSLRWLVQVQFQQDLGTPWGEAVEWADANDSLV